MPLLPNLRKTNLAHNRLMLRNKLNRLHDKNIKSDKGLNLRELQALKRLSKLWSYS